MSGQRQMLTPELAFVVAACRIAFDAAAPLPTVDPALDWPLVLRLARFHRVQGLMWKALADSDTLPATAALPITLAKILSTDAAAIAVQNLRMAAESAVLNRLLVNAEVPHLFIKGLPLAILAYGEMASKSGKDIDLLVAAEHLSQAARILGKRGYRCREPVDQPPFGRLARWHRARKESVWWNPDTDLHVDLHTRLSDNIRLIPTIGPGSPAQQVEIARGIAIPTLTDVASLAYLPVHGASSAWFRLKWIVDFAALLHCRGGNDPEALLSRMEELGAGRAAGLALLLADDLFDSLQKAPELRRRLKSDPVVRWLTDQAMLQLAGASDPKEPTQSRFGTFRIHLIQVALGHGLGFAVSEMWRQGLTLIQRPGR